MASGHDIRIIKKLDSGGMAEVYLGEIVGPRGISKRVAIKRILPHLGKHEKFVSMFLDEARLAMNLSHANIVQTFEVGIHEDSYFIVMEYIDGASLKHLLTYLQERDTLIPVPIAVYIAMEVGKGLAYAHKARDSRGRPLNIVHRDVSPPNILISTQGEVKVVDFGLAKAASQLENTEPGIIKGKFSYLSPEALMGLDIDHRADIFSLGIVLFEMLTGRRLFYGSSDLETVKQVERAYVPSVVALNPNVPYDLELVLRKALRRDRDERYQSCDQFVEDLNNVLFSHGLRVTSKDVARLIRQIRDQDGKTGKSSGYSLSSSADFLKGFSLSNDQVIDEIEEITDVELLEEEDDSEEISGIVDPREWLDDLEFDGDLAFAPDAADGSETSAPDHDNVLIREPAQRKSTIPDMTSRPKDQEGTGDRWSWLDNIMKGDSHDGKK